MSQRNLQPRLVCETSMDMLDSLVKALGGPKVVGARLWPAKDPDSAGHRVRDCINPNRRENIGLDEFFAMLKLAREIEYHGAAEWIADFTGYAVTPISTEDETTRLQKLCVDQFEALKLIYERLEKKGLV